MPDRPPPPIDVPPGVRLAWEHRGRLLPVRVEGRVAYTVAGEFPRRPPPPRKRKGEDAGLFAAVSVPPPPPARPAAVILVLFTPGRRDNADAVSSLLYRAGYETEVRPDPEAT